MAKKSAKKSSEDKETSIQASIKVGRDVGGNIIVGEGNTININPEQAVFRSLHQLPQPPADFTGRKALIDELLKDFKKSKGATITGKSIKGLTGMGGIGKTALGLKVAHQIANDYQDAQIFIDLKGTTEPLSAMDIMRHVILSFEPTMDLRAMEEIDMAKAYRSILHGKRALLFFDNARSADQIAPLTPPETCAMLVTSRWTFSVAGLQNRRVDVMGEGEAESFLLELCPRIGENTAKLAKACGYLPLALRIAGSFLQVNSEWSIEKYLAQLHDRRKRLETLQESRAEAELKGEPDLLATFELSYNALTEENRKRWRMLGVFPATFAKTATQAMWEAEENKTARLLGSFRRYSLLEFDETSSRYSLHDLLTDYALAQMEDVERQEARFKHASHYKEVLSAADDLYLEGGENILPGLKLLDLEWENIRTGHAWLETKTDKKIDTNGKVSELLAQYPQAGVYVLDLRLHPREKIDWLTSSVQTSREIGDRRGEGADLGNLGNAYAALGETRKAIEFYEERMVIAREIGDRRGEGNALFNMGLSLNNLDEKVKAVDFVKGALEIYLAIESPYAEHARSTLKEWGVEEQGRGEV